MRGKSSKKAGMKDDTYFPSSEISLAPDIGQEFRSTSPHSSSQWHWEVQQSLGWPVLKWRSAPAWGYNRPLLNALCSPGLYNLFVPSLSIGIYNLEPPGNHRVRRWGELFTALGRASLASCLAPAGQERKGKAVYVCKGPSLNQWGYGLYGKQGWAWRVGSAFLPTAKSPR